MKNESTESKGIMRPCLLGFAAMLAFLTGALHAADAAPFTPAADAKGDWSFTPDSKLPDVLIIGDSISIGYTREVRAKLAGMANVHRPMRGKGPDNCGDTTIGLKNIDHWLGGRKWDVIHFNWGLWDLCYRNPQSKAQGNRDKVGGKLSTTPEDYEKNLEQLVARMKSTGAKLIWASTTMVPEGEVGRFVGDDAKYNAIAARVMLKHGIPTDDLFALSKEFGGRYSTKAGDVHFTEEGSGKLAAQVADTIAKALPQTKTAPAAAGKPNIIFILSDDLAQGDLGCYGQKLIQTPNIDRMAAAGTRFTQAYCGTTVCAPSRTSLMTGLHMGHSPVRANREIKPEGQLPLPAETLTVAQVLKSAGYSTACIGKWGMGMFDTTGSPLKKGFDHFFGYNCQRHAHSYFPTYLYNDAQRVELPGNDGNTRVDGKGAVYAQDLIADETLKWVRAQKDKPFFLYYSVTLPHAATQIPDQGIYKDKPWSMEEKNYAAMITRLDSDVGRLLDLLAELDLDRNTLVMIAGDNGSSFPPESAIGRRFNQASNGMRGFKRALYEGGLRQAAIARWPGVVPAGRVSDEPWAFWDFLPTAAELAGAKIPATCKPDGISLVSHLKGGPAPQREFFYWELHEGPTLQALRWGDWKAVRNGPSKPIEIYNLKTDAAESDNLAAGHPELVATAEAMMKAARVDDPNFPLRDVKPGAGGKNKSQEKNNKTPSKP